MGLFNLDVESIINGITATEEYKKYYEAYVAHKSLINYENLTKAYVKKNNAFNIWDNFVALQPNSGFSDMPKPKNSSTLNMLLNLQALEEKSKISKESKQTYKTLKMLMYGDDLDGTKSILPLLDMNFELLILGRNNRQQKFEAFQDQMLQYKLNNHTPEEVEIAEEILNDVKKRMDAAIANENEVLITEFKEKSKKIMAEIGRSTGNIPSNLAYQVENVKRQRRYEQEEKEAERIAK